MLRSHPPHDLGRGSQSDLPFRLLPNEKAALVFFPSLLATVRFLEKEAVVRFRLADRIAQSSRDRGGLSVEVWGVRGAVMPGAFLLVAATGVALVVAFLLLLYFVSPLNHPKPLSLSGAHVVVRI